MAEKPNYRDGRRDVKMTERVAMAAVGNSAIRAQKVHDTDTGLMFAERASGYHTRPHMHDCEQMNYIVSGEMYFFLPDFPAADPFRVAGAGQPLRPHGLNRKPRRRHDPDPVQ